MTIITPGDPADAPYRRRAVLEALKGLAYEAPDPRNIETTLADLAGSGSIFVGQLGNILNQLEGLRLARFEVHPESDRWRSKVTVRNLNQQQLEKLIADTRRDTGHHEEPSKRKSRSPRRHEKGRHKDFYARHPFISNIFVAIVAGLLLILAPHAYEHAKLFLSHRTSSTYSSR